MNNNYGLDANYFREALGLIVRDVENYTPAEMALALERLSKVAKHQYDQVMIEAQKRQRKE